MKYFNELSLYIHQIVSFVNLIMQYKTITKIVELNLIIYQFFLF